MKSLKLSGKLSGLINFSPGYKHFQQKTGLPPGTPVYTGSAPAEPLAVELIDYDETTFQQTPLETVEECFACKDTPTVSWINLTGLHEVEKIQRVAEHFNLHPLVQEDIVHIGQRPKLEAYEDYLFIVMKMLMYDETKQTIESEQVSFIVRDHCLMTFQERKGDVFEQIRERLRAEKGRIRKMGADYLAYALIDAILDHYFQIMDVFGGKIEAQEEMLLTHFHKDILPQVHHLKRDLTLLRKSVWPLREMVGGLERSESSLIGNETRVFLRDLYDHTIQIIDTIESFRDVTSGLMDLYLSMLSNRMNEVMKILTLIATIFIPLSFIAGVFGMNFEWMPELQWRWAYPAGFWGAILVTIGCMVWFFKRKKWL